MFAPPLAIILAHSSMGVGVLCVMLAVLVFGSMRYKTAIVAISFTWALVLIPAYFLFKSGRGLFHDSDRLVIWSAVHDWWHAFGPKLFGTGQGTGQLWFPRIHHLAGIANNSSWYFLHSDWLQVLFEQGVAGLIAYLALFTCAALRLIKTQRFDLLASLCALAATSLGNYSFRIAVPCVVGVYLIADAFMAYQKSDSASKMGVMVNRE